MCRKCFIIWGKDHFYFHRGERENAEISQRVFNRKEQEVAEVSQKSV